ALARALNKAGLRARELYCYDVRHAIKDFGWLGQGKAEGIQPGPSMQEALKLPAKNLLSEWTSARIEELRHHPKTSARYGFLRETLPRAFRLKVPPELGIGHEIYALAEK
ncbi:MAG: hypothetical protein ACXWP5_15685, partial [Bdellovibrionota bacterium]